MKIQSIKTLYVFIAAFALAVAAALVNRDGLMWVFGLFSALLVATFLYKVFNDHE